MDIDTLIKVVQDGAERPDFSMENPWFAMQVQRSISQAHSLGWFPQDLTSTGKLSVSANMGTFNFTFTGSIRTVQDIKLFDKMQQPLVAPYKFEEGSYSYRPKDYFDYPARFYYYLFGNDVVANFPQATEERFIELVYYQFPQVSYDANTDAYVCDSFILRNYPGLVVYDLLTNVAAITSDAQQNSMAQQYNADMLQMMADQRVK